MSNQLKDLERRIEEQAAKIKALEAKVPQDRRPSVKMERWDPTSNFQMPASARQAMVDCVPDPLFREQLAPTSLPGARPSEDRTIPSQRGWVDAKPLEKWKPGD